jgi:hypothetical protein
VVVGEATKRQLRSAAGKITPSILSLVIEEKLACDVNFMVAFSKSYFVKHMTWLQCIDEQSGDFGHLATCLVTCQSEPVSPCMTLNILRCPAKRILALPSSRPWHLKSMEMEEEKMKIMRCALCCSEDFDSDKGERTMKAKVAC